MLKKENLPKRFHIGIKIIKLCLILFILSFLGMLGVTRVASNEIILNAAQILPFFFVGIAAFFSIICAIVLVIEYSKLSND